MLLKTGSNGAAVRDLQTMLNAAGASPKLKVDGDFGDLTETAVRAAQERLGLVVDGEAGKYTLAALKQATTPAKPGRQEPDKSAMQGSAEIIYVDFKGKAKAPPNVATLQLLDTARPINEIDWHCAATPEGKHFTVADIRAWHKQRGWSDIGYHYVVYLDGSIHLGRPIGQTGAHIEGRNAGTAGCVYVGGVSKDGKTAKDTRTPAQRSSILWLTQQLAKKHKKVKRIAGHNEFSSKACPSFDVRKDDLGNLPGFVKGKAA